MSALGQKQTFAMQNVMSALPPIADICSAQAMSAWCQKQTLGQWVLHIGFGSYAA